MKETREKRNKKKTIDWSILVAKTLRNKTKETRIENNPPLIESPHSQNLMFSSFSVSTTTKTNQKNTTNTNRERGEPSILSSVVMSSARPP